MSAASLPLRDLHLPDTVGWWPPAPGWWVLFALLAAALGFVVLRSYRRWQRNAPRRHALKEIARCEAEYLRHRNPVLLAKELSQLLRRGMLAYAPRAEIAGLTGDAWLQWLDQGMPLPYFHTEGGKSLLQLPYRSPEDDCSDVDIDALLTAVRMRLSVPLRRAA